MDVLGGFLTARNIEVAPARRAGTDEDRVPALSDQHLQAVDAFAADELDAEVENVIAFLVDDRFRQPELRNLTADHAAGLGILIEDHAGIALRREIARHRERGRAAADQRDAFAVLGRRRFRQPVADIVLVVGRHALQAADGDRLGLHASAPARRLARTVAGAPKNSRKYVGLPVDHIGIAVAAFGDQPDVFWNRGMGRAGPLAIDHFVEVIRRLDIGEFHRLLLALAPELCRG